LLLVPVCIEFLVADGATARYAAFAAFAVASVTDLLDGELARRRNLITDFGKIADPIADKALTGSALVTLSALGELAWWVTLVILARELFVTALRFWVIRRGVIAASRGGKLKTLLQVIAISLYILPWHLTAARQALMGAAVLVTVATGADYTARAIRLHRAVPHHPLTGPAAPDPPAPAPAAPLPAGPASAGTPSSGAAPYGTPPAGAAPAGARSAGPPSAGTVPAGACPSSDVGASADGDSAPSEPAPDAPRGPGGPAAPGRSPS
jgi:CDP-diacylglycerol--glycerol-3-phosphate 3-phosphatidyltransferase